MTTRQDTATQVAQANLIGISDEQQTILRRYYLEHHTMADISNDLGITQAQARQMRDDALTHLNIEK